MCDVDRLVARAREKAERAYQQMLKRGVVGWVARQAADNDLAAELDRISGRPKKKARGADSKATPAA